MPGLEDLPKSSTLTEAPIEQQADQDQQPPVRELTQTDRINRQLLKSFLERINTSGLERNFQNATNGNVTDSSDQDSFED